jgi:hypothetical protein
MTTVYTNEKEVWDLLPDMLGAADDTLRWLGSRSGHYSNEGVG